MDHIKPGVAFIALFAHVLQLSNFDPLNCGMCPTRSTAVNIDALCFLNANACGLLYPAY
jgi:hypothetical protein